MKRLVLLLFLILPCPAFGQTISVSCPPMPIHRVRVGLFLCDRNIEDAVVTFVDGTRLEIASNSVIGRMRVTSFMRVVLREWVRG